MEYICSVCGESVPSDLIVYVSHTQKHIMDEIQSQHPEWKEGSGVCQHCVEYFNEQIHGKD